MILPSATVEASDPTPPSSTPKKFAPVAGAVVNVICEPPLANT